MSSRVGRSGQEINLTIKFYANGVLFDPYSVSDVDVLNNSPNRNVIDTVTPQKVSTGIYRAIWDADVTPGIYYDRWTWQAEAAMAEKVQTYTFKITGGCVDSPPKSTGPLFVGNPEVAFFNSLTKELVQRIVNQRVIYYSVSAEHTKVDDLYDEAITKTVYNPVGVNALVLYNEPTQTVTQFSVDTVYSIEVYFHYHELEERRIIPREGDFVKFGDILYEIEKLVRPQITYGQMNHEVMVKANCRVARKSQIKILDGLKGLPEGV